MSDKRIKFLNTHVDNLTMEEAVGEARKLVRKGERSYVVTPNVDHIVKIEHDHLFREIYEGADLILTDGKPLIWMSRLLRTPIKEKISGSDYFCFHILSSSRFYFDYQTISDKVYPGKGVLSSIFPGYTRLFKGLDSMF